MNNDSIPQKRCTNCNIEYLATAEFFYKDTSYKLGLRASCRNCDRAKAKIYAELHVQERREVSRKWSQDNPNQKRLNRRNWQRSHPEYNRSRMKQWHKKHPEDARQRVHKRKSILACASGSHTKEDIQFKYDQQLGLCAYCGCELDEKYHVDHIRPLSRGGSNDASNLAIACPHCNTSKGNKLLSEWRRK